MHTNCRDLLLAGCCAASTPLLWSITTRLRAEESDPPPETTTIRLQKSPSICIAPMYVVSDLLNAEGFTNVVYVETGMFVDSGATQNKAIWKADVDFNLNFSGPLLLEIDRGLSTTILAGIYVGCFELFARDGIRSVADLKGRTVGIQSLEFAPACIPERDGDACWAQSRQGYRVGDEREAQTDRIICGRQDRRLPRISPRTSTFARAEHRSRHRQQRAGSAMVAVLLLHAGGQSRIRSKEPYRHQACGTRHAPGHRFVRERAGPCCTAHGG